MFSSADKAVKVSPAVQQKAAAGNSFFGKTGGESFFDTKEGPSFFGKLVQAKLTVSTPDDPQEKEADAVANKVMRMSSDERLAVPLKSLTDTPVQKKCSACEGEEKLHRKEEKKEEEEVQAKADVSPGAKIYCKEDHEEKLQPVLNSITNGRKAKGHPDTKPITSHSRSINRKNISLFRSDIMRRGERGPPAPSAQFEQSLASSKGSGSALPNDTRQFMESRFNADFGGVRIHTGLAAESLTSSVQAKAFAHSNDIYFNKGQFSPHTAEGGTLLAHELTHTIQQGASVTKVNLSKSNIVTAKRSQINLRSAEESSDQSNKDFINAESGKKINAGTNTNLDNYKISENASNKELSKGVDPKFLRKNPIASVQNDNNALGTQDLNKSSSLHQEAEWLAKSDSSIVQNKSPIKAAEKPQKNEQEHINSPEENSQNKSPPFTIAEPKHIAQSLAVIQNSASQANNSSKTESITNTSGGDHGAVQQMPVTLSTDDEKQRLQTQDIGPQTDRSSEISSQSKAPPSNNSSEWASVFVLHEQKFKQASEENKASVFADSNAQKQFLNQSFTVQSNQINTNHDQAEQSLHRSANESKTNILVERDTHLAAVETQTHGEMSRLDDTVQEHQSALKQTSAQKAQMAEGNTRDQATRANQESEQHAAQAGRLAPGFTLSSVPGIGTVLQKASQFIGNVFAKIQQTGKEMVSVIVSAGQWTARALINVGRQVAAKFNEVLAAGRKQIMLIRNKVISAFHEIVNQVFTTLDQAKSSILSRLKQGRNKVIQQLTSGLQKALSVIDSWMNQIFKEIELMLGRAIQKLKSLTREINRYLAAAPLPLRNQILNAVVAELERTYNVWNNTLQQIISLIIKALKREIYTIINEVITQVSDAINSIKQTVADFVTKAKFVVDGIKNKILEIAGAVIRVLPGISDSAASHLRTASGEMAGRFDNVISDNQNKVSDLTTQGMTKQDGIVSGVAGKMSSVSSSVVSASLSSTDVWEFIKGTFVGIKEWFVDIFKGIGDFFSWWYDNLKKNPIETLIITYVVLVIVGAVIAIAIIFPAVGAVILEILLAIGIILGALSVIYYLYKMIVTPGLTPYERGKFFGKALVEIVLLIFSILEVVKDFKSLANILKLVEDTKLVFRLLSLSKFNFVKLEALLRTGIEVEKLIKVLEFTKDAGTALELVKLVPDVDLLISLLGKSGMTASKLLALLKLGLTPLELIDLLKVLKVEELEIIIKVKGITGKNILELLKVATPSQLVEFSKVSGMTFTKLEDLLTLPGMTATLLSDFFKVSKMTLTRLDSLLATLKNDVSLLEDLINLTEDAELLEDLLVLEKDGKALKDYLKLAGGKSQAANLKLLFQKAISLGDVKRLDGILIESNGDAIVFQKLIDAVSRIKRLPLTQNNLNLRFPRPPYIGLSNNSIHFMDHTFEFVNLRNRIGKTLGTTFWPDNPSPAMIESRVQEVVNELTKATPPRIISAGSPGDVAISGFTVQVGTQGNASNLKIGQFFPTPAGGGIHYSQSEIIALQSLFMH